MTALAAGIGGVSTTASATAAAAKGTNPRCRITVHRFPGAAAAYARPAAAARIRLIAAAALIAGLSRHAGIAGHLQSAAGLS
jgi:hypothetical protein